MCNQSVETLNALAFAKKWCITIIMQRYSNKRTIRISSIKNWHHHIITSDITNPIFIIGSPRSGTTFLGEILDAIPNISYYYEPPIVKYYARLVYEDLVSFNQAKRFYTWIYRSLLKLAPREGGIKLVDKTPRNIFIVEVLREIFPGAKFIHIYRDGRDVACSLLNKPWHLAESKKLNKREPGGYLYGPYPHFYIESNRKLEYMQTSDIHRCIWIWKRHVEKGIELERKLPSYSYLNLKYETLVSKPKKSIKIILDFIDENNCSAYQHALAIAFKSYKSSIGRWQKELQESDVITILDEAESILNELGYHT